MATHSINPKGVLVTGGSGFIGQHLVRKLVADGQSVILYDLNPPSDSTLLVNWRAADIFDTSKLQTAISEAKAIIHLVGLADAGVAQHKPMLSYRLNVDSLQQVLEACRASDIKVIFPSSAAIYGITEDLPIKESSPVTPTNIYSWHKHICEQMIRSYHANFGIEFVILRLFNVFGRGNKGVIDSFLEQAKSGQNIQSFGPHQYRDFVYAGDVAESLFRATIYEKAVNHVINVGSGRGTRISDILDIVCELFPEARWHEVEREFSMYDSIADINLAQTLLDLNPQSSEQSMRRIILEEMM